MYSLTDKQIDFILDDIRARGIKMESLQQDLLDHVCCIIENNLDANGNFEDFYARTIPTFYKKELCEIEEETILLLTFKHYYTMKKIMIGSGALSVVAFIFGSFLKIMHLAGASALLMLAILTACLVFLPLMFVLKLREDNSQRDKLVTGVGTVFGIIMSLSVLFKIQHWPYANMMWMVSLGILGLVFIPTYFFTGIRNPETKVNTIVSSILMTFIAGLLFSLTSLRPSQPSIEEKLAIYLKNEELLTQIRQKNQADTAKNAETAKIYQLCAETKAFIFQHEIHQGSLPNDYQNKNILFNDGVLGDSFFAENEGGKLLKELSNQISTYNSTHSTDKIPLNNTILTEDLAGAARLNNLIVLNSLTQIQISLQTLK